MSNILSLYFYGKKSVTFGHYIIVFRFTEIEAK